jgi:hypothetical protein
MKESERKRLAYLHSNNHSNHSHSHAQSVDEYKETKELEKQLGLTLPQTNHSEKNFKHAHNNKPDEYGFEHGQRVIQPQSRLGQEIKIHKNFNHQELQSYKTRLAMAHSGLLDEATKNGHKW